MFVTHAAWRRPPFPILESAATAEIREHVSGRDERRNVALLERLSVAF